MSAWRTVHKGSINISLRFAGTFSNNLFASHFDVRIGGVPGLRFDMSSNLKGRNRQTNTYMDARQLADGDIMRLETIQLSHPAIIQGVSESSSAGSRKDAEIELILLLETEYYFRCMISETHKPPNLIIKVLQVKS